MATRTMYSNNHLLWSIWLGRPTLFKYHWNDDFLFHKMKESIAIFSKNPNFFLTKDRLLICFLLQHSLHQLKLYFTIPIFNLYKWHLKISKIPPPKSKQNLLLRWRGKLELKDLGCNQLMQWCSHQYLWFIGE